MLTDFYDNSFVLYTKNVNIDVMLKGYSGDTIRVDRIRRESESIMNPCLSILLMTQPKVVSDALSNATFRGRGLTAQFLYCLPQTSVGTRKFQSSPVPLEDREVNSYCASVCYGVAVAVSYGTSNNCRSSVETRLLDGSNFSVVVNRCD